MHRLKFISEFLKNFKSIGSVTPSSKFLIDRLLKKVDFSKDTCIIELGPGTGCITKELLKRMGKNSSLLAFEINKEFCKVLESIHDRRLRVINISAECLHSYLRLNKIKPDCILSSLPLGAWPEKTSHKVLKSIFLSLKQKGKYIQYQYTLKNYSKIKQLFESTELDFVLLNIPPAFIYVCSK